MKRVSIEWHETCKCKCRLDASVCNNKQRWNDDKCRCECKELIDKGVCDKESKILVIIFSDFLMFYEIFLSPQVKRIMIISTKLDIYELPHELPNDLRLRILGS